MPFTSLLRTVSGNLNTDTDEPNLVRATPSVPFEPSLDGKEGVLVPGYNVSHPVYRGHTNVTVTLPSGLSWYTLQVSTLKHAHGYGAVQDLLSSYTRVTTFVGPSSLNWYTATDKSGAGTRWLSSSKCVGNSRISPI